MKIVKSSNPMTHLAIRVLLRILTLPFVTGILTITYTRGFLKHNWRWLRYGGELVSYDKNTNPETMLELYEKVINEKSDLSEFNFKHYLNRLTTDQDHNIQRYRQTRDALQKSKEDNLKLKQQLAETIGEMIATQSGAQHSADTQN